MSDSTRTYQDRITADPAVLGGKPVVRGTRIAVSLVLEELAKNPDIRELLAAHPDLTRADVQACLGYAKALGNGGGGYAQATQTGSPKRPAGMKFLFDQSADFRLIDHLQARNHDVTAISRDYPHSLADTDVPTIVRTERRILIVNGTSESSSSTSG